MHPNTTYHVAYVITQPEETLILDGAVCESPQDRRLYDISEKSKYDYRAPELLAAIDNGEVRSVVLTRNAAVRLGIEQLPELRYGSLTVSVWAMQFMMADKGHLYCRGRMAPALSKEAIALFGSREPVKPANTMGPQGSICELAKVRLRPSLESSPADASTATLHTASLRGAEASSRANTTSPEASSTETNVPSTEAPEFHEPGTLPESGGSRARIFRLLNLTFKKRRKRRRRQLRKLHSKGYQRIGERCERMNIRIHTRDLELLKETCPEGTKFHPWVRSILLGEDPIKIVFRNYRRERASQEGHISNNISQIRKRTIDSDMAQYPRSCLVIIGQTQRFKQLIEAIPHLRVIRKRRKPVQFKESGFDTKIRFWVSKEEKNQIDKRSGTTKRERSKWIRAELSNAVNRILSSSLDTDSSIEIIVLYGKKLNDEIAKKLNSDKAAGIPSDARQVSNEFGDLVDSLIKQYPQNTKGTP